MLERTLTKAGLNHSKGWDMPDLYVSWFWWEVAMGRDWALKNEDM